MRAPLLLRRGATSAWHRLPHPARAALVAAASLVGGGPVVGAPHARRVLVVAPHPDDETIGAGGTIAMLAAAGARVDVLSLTDGEGSIGTLRGSRSIGRQRAREMVAACAVLGLRPPRRLGLPDGAVTDHVSDVTAAVGDALLVGGHDLVLAPWLLDGHPDHIAAARAVAAATAPDDTVLWGYETHVPLPPTRLVDISAVIEVKRAALFCHATAGAAFDLEATLGLGRWRSTVTDAGRGHAEAFLACRWDELPALTSRIDRLASLPV